MYDRAYVNPLKAAKAVLCKGDYTMAFKLKLNFNRRHSVMDLEGASALIYSYVAAAMITASTGSCPNPSEQSAVQISSLLSCLTERKRRNTVRWSLSAELWRCQLKEQLLSRQPSPNVPWSLDRMQTRGLSFRPLKGQGTVMEIIFPVLAAW